MACGCSTIETPPCGLSVEVCKGWYVALDFIAVSITNQPDHGTLIDLGENHYIYQHDDSGLDSDLIEYNNGTTTCTINITILDTVPEDTQLVTFIASGECLVGEPTYHWTLPVGVTLHSLDTLYQQTIHVYVPLYDPENPDAEYELKVDICCGNCNDCCKCDTIIWHPPICTTECGEDPDCYCNDPCLQYNPLTGNCEPICPPDLKCCPLEVEEAKQADIQIPVMVLSPTFKTAQITDLDITLIFGSTQPITDMYIIGSGITCQLEDLTSLDCLSNEDPSVDVSLCGDVITISNINQDIGTDVRVVSSAADRIMVTYYNISPIATLLDVDFTITVKIVDGPDTAIRTVNVSGTIDTAENIYVPDPIILTTDIVSGVPLCHKQIDVAAQIEITCQECCDDLDCPTGLRCENGVCVCPSGDPPDPITGLCPCPDPIPVCNTCIPTTTGYILTPYGDSEEDCIGQYHVFNTDTCSCDCAVGSCYQRFLDNTISECQQCPECALNTDYWFVVNPDGTHTQVLSVSCATCYYCSDNVCVPISCDPGTIPNPRPNSLPCCVPDPCTTLLCDECPDVVNCGCDPIITNGTCVNCNQIDCITNDECPLGCDCDTEAGKCKDNPCDQFICDGIECPQTEDCGCIEARCIPCNTVPCPIGNECPFGCACDENTQVCIDNPCVANQCDDPVAALYCPSIPDCGCDDIQECIPCNTVTCVNNADCPLGCSCDSNTNLCDHNPCFTAQCNDEDDLLTYCPVIDGCGCDDLECIPCDTVPCPIGNECPFGCRCGDNDVCEQDPCATLEIECGLNVVEYTYEFNLLHSVNTLTNVLTVTVDLATSLWLTDSILSAPLSDILDWEINLSSYEDGYMPIAAVNTFIGGTPVLEIANGITIDLDLMSYDFLMIRCTVKNTEVGGNPISITYRYQVISTEEPEWKEALGSICYTAYTIQPNVGVPFDGVTHWYIDYNADEVADLTITPTDPEISLPVYTGGGSGYEVAFAGNEYLIITCPQAGTYVVTADVNSGECLDVTACGVGTPCPCTGNASCEGDPVILNQLEGNIWTVGIDFFDGAGFQKPWRCEPLSPLQFCDGGVQSYNTNCGGLLPIAYASATLIPTELCCIDDVLIVGTPPPWGNISEVPNNNWLNNSGQCLSCCCGWAHSGINLLEINGASITAEITSFQEAKLCFQMNLSGGGTNIGDPCCKFVCVTPPEQDCLPITVDRFEIGCTEDNDGYTFSFSINNPNGDGPYSIEIPNSNVCSGLPCLVSGSPCGTGNDCVCLPDSATTNSCQPYPFIIPLPSYICDIPGVPIEFCQPYNSEDVITVVPPFPLFPLTPESPQPFIITDLSTGCQVQYVGDIPCCQNFYVVAIPNTCIKQKVQYGTTIPTSIVGYTISVVGNYDTLYDITIEIDYDMESDPTPSQSMNWFSNVCATNPGMECVLSNNGNANGIYTNITGDSVILFGSPGMAAGLDHCPSAVWNLFYGNLANYEFTITISPSNAPNCTRVITLNNMLLAQYLLSCGIESTNITVQILNHTLGTLYNVVVSSECGTPIVSQAEDIITISGCTATVQDVYVTITNAIDPNNTTTITIPAAEISAIRSACPCMDVIGFYDCDKDELNILVNGSTYGNGIDFMLNPVGFACTNLYNFVFTGPTFNFNFSDLGCTTLSGTEYTFEVTSVEHDTCIGQFTIDTSICDTPCMTDPSPSFTYDCDAGFSFSNITEVDHIYFVNGQYTTCPDANCIEIFEADPCPGGCFEGSGVLWFVYSNGCNALLGINNMPHSVIPAVTVFPDPPANLPYLVCEPDAHVTFQVIGGTPPFTITSSVGLFAPYTLNTTDVQVSIAVTDLTPTPGLSTVEIASDVITCPVEIEVDYNCIQDCLNDPSLYVQCDGCEYQQVWYFGPYDVNTTNVRGFQYVEDGNPPANLGTPPSGSNFFSWMGGAYVTTTLPNLGVDVITVDAGGGLWHVYVVAPCCTMWDSLELSISNNWIAGINNGPMSCQQIRNYDENHQCCFCFFAVKTGVVTSPTITDQILVGCKYNTGSVIWTPAPMLLDNVTTECINCKDLDPNYSPSIIYFQREIEYADGCLRRELAYLLHDSGASILYCRLSTQGFFLIELENVGVLPIPSGTTFDLNWKGLGASRIFSAITNCTIDISGASITTTALIPIGGKIKFQARYSNIGCAINSNTVEITSSNITLNWTPIIITKTL